MTAHTVQNTSTATTGLRRKEEEEEEEEGKHLIAHLKQERGNDSYTHRESCLNTGTPLGGECGKDMNLFMLSLHTAAACF